MTAGNGSRKRVFGFVVFCLAVTTLLLYRSELLAPKNIYSHYITYYNETEDTGKSPNNTIRLVLYWTTFFGQADFWVGFGPAPFNDCPVSLCETTNDRKRLAQADAIVFHIRDLDLSHLPPFRLPHQRWIFFNYESPANTFTSVVNMKHLFNWTMTYRTDSDIVRMYSDHSFAVNPFTEDDERVLAQRLRMKNKLVAWIVSHCKTPNKREKYVRNLQKHVAVDVYGKCGPLKCQKDCYQQISSQYKFYLAFENSHHQDYVTEKFYNTLKSDMVPIVYSAVNYSEFAPEGSFIDVRNFRSERHLADYLNYLDGNQTAYEEYFEWRKTVVLKPWCSGSHPPEEMIPYGAESQCRPKAWCQLCRMLHDPTLPSQSYADMHQWWVVKAKYEGSEAMSTERPEWANLWTIRSHSSTNDSISDVV